MTASGMTPNPLAPGFDLDCGGVDLMPARWEIMEGALRRGGGSRRSSRRERRQWMGSSRWWWGGGVGGVGGRPGQNSAAWPVLAENP
jgi:hypothetical protein